MKIASYSLFAALAAITVLSPGPGVLLTVSNSIRHGKKYHKQNRRRDVHRVRYRAGDIRQIVKEFIYV